MILGIDVGGTHTDAVLIDSYSVVKKAKVVTNQDNLLQSLLEVTGNLLKDVPPDEIDRVVLSTTMSTNAIIQGKASRVGMIIASGPGLSQSLLKINKDTRFVSGYMNHRGVKVADIDQHEISGIVEEFKAQGIDHIGIVGKFSPRNPRIETEIQSATNDTFKHVSLGHRMSGKLNFPRRIATTYLNAAIWDIYNNFVDNITKHFSRIDSNITVNILKADGGTFKIKNSADYPVQTILSGPAASIMGILSLTDCKEDSIALDIGGTTTDIAVFADGVPLLEPLGVTIEGHKTLIRGLLTKSIGVGGDSRVRYQNGELFIGPEREGPAAAFGGPYPTPTDAMIVLGLTDIGNKVKAGSAIGGIAKEMQISTEDAARHIFDHACSIIVSAVKEMVEEINNRPVYTVHEVLEGKKIIPKEVYVVGGPARPMASHLGKLLGCTPCIPDHSEVANAVGAALARTTTEVTLLADTEKKTITIVEEGIQNHVSPKFTHQDALEICKEILKERAIRMGAKERDLEIEITEDQVFNMVRNGYRTGQNIRVKAQIKPGLISNFTKGERRA